jgi:hypothetical protein
VTFSRLRSVALGVALVLATTAAGALAESVPFNCVILPGETQASVMMTNSLGVDASCIVTCKFSTTKYDNNPQITCAKPVPAGKEVEMCEIGSGGDKLTKAIAGSADCSKLPQPGDGQGSLHSERIETSQRPKIPPTTPPMKRPGPAMSP